MLRTADADGPIIRVENLVKRYRKADRNAVDDVSFTVDAGEFFVLLGPNGAGKTTTISILTTTLAPTAGRVSIAGFDTERQSSQVRRNVGIIFQRPSLDQNLSGEENVRFHAILYGLYPYRPTYTLMPQAYKDRVKQLADVVGLGGELFKPVKTYSGGMKRKLEIVRSLVHRPKVLFLDEPTVGLDPLSRRNVWDYLREVRHTHGTTVFLTTHYLDEGEEADRVCIVNKGKVVTLGTPAQVKSDLIDPYVLVDADDRAALWAELAAMPYPCSGEGPFRVSAQGEQVHQLLRRVQTPLSLVQTHAPTLEDAYLQVVGGDVLEAAEAPA